MTSRTTERSKQARLLAGLCLAGGVCAASPAAAGPWGRYRELQVDDAVFADVVTDVIDRLGGTFCATTMPCIGNENETCVLERVRSATPGYFSYGTQGTVELDGGLSVSGPEILYTLSIELDQMTLACANDPGCVPDNCSSYPACLPPGSFATHSVPVSFELSTSGSEVCLAVHEIAFGAVDPSLLSEVGMPDKFCFGSELGAVDQLMQPLLPGATAITWDNVQNLVAVRTDYLPPNGTNSAIDADRTQAFTTFVNGTAAGGAPSQDWNILLSGTALAESLEENLRNTLNTESKLRLQQGGSVGSMFLPGIVTASADADAYTNSFCDWVDISPLWISMSPSLSSNAQQLEIHSEIGWSVNGWDVTACILSNPIGFLLAPISVPIGLAVANNQGPSNVPSFGNLSCAEVEPQSGDTALDCTASVPQLSTSIAGGTLSFALTGDMHTFEGWRLYGNLNSQGVGVSNGPWEAHGGIGFGVSGGCSSLHIGYHGSATLDGPVQLCDVDIMENPHGVYDIGEFEPAPGNIRVAELTFPTILSTLCPNGNGSYSSCPPGQSELDAFWQNPQPFEVRLTTTHGMRTFAVPAPEQATSDDYWAAQMELINAKIICMSPQTGFLGIPGMFDPEWMIDPPPFMTLTRDAGRRIEQLGIVQLTGIEVGFDGSPIETTGAMSLDAVTVVVQATALVDAGETYEVPVTFETEMAFEVEAFRDGTAHFTQVTDSLTDIDLSARLPRSLDGAGFTALLPAGTIEANATY